MERRNESITLEPASYSYIKTLLFGFSGWDRYILTEDIELSTLLEEIIRRHCPQVFYRYKIIFVGGGSQVTSLLKRNVAEQFLADPQHVIAILDGDQDGLRHARQDNVYFIPFPNVEQALIDRSKDANFPYQLPNAVTILTDKKQFYKAVLATRSMSGAQVITYLCDHYDPQMAKLSSALNRFLSIA
ncbi:hypothetical protein [Rhodanobacter glycinis]|uniref:hypothetical protein n=1 Tax=Rhodanobacter glycinis TaxID=582702 RepID=UPI0011269BE0|nr:hypothetical protein [Rhodanobacter glycinis]